MREPGTKRKQQAMATRKKILDCALDLFEEKGFDNVSMEEIAQKSDSSIGAIYHYFRSKEEIAAQTTKLLDEEYQTFFEKLFTEPQYRDISSLERLKAYLYFVLQSSASLSNLKSTYIYSLKHVESMPLSVNEERIFYQECKELLALCRLDGYLPESFSDHEIIEFLTQIIRGLLVDWMVRGRDFCPEEKSRQLLQIFFNGLK